MWRRIAGEILLRAHEDLAEAGVLSPLPSVTGDEWRQALHARPAGEMVEPLEEALARSGSPSPMP